MGDLVLPNDQLLLRFPPRLRKIIKEVWINGKIGISSMNMKVHPNSAKSCIDEYGTYMDSFTLEIPYAGRQLFWEVIFKEEDYDYAPDFEFTNDLFLFDPDVNIISSCIPSLSNWNVDNPKSLVGVIKEFMALYKKFQVTRLQTENRFSRLYNQYKILTSELNNSENNVEVYIDSNATVHFLVCINVNFSCLPPYIQPLLFVKTNRDVLNPHEDTATLRVSFLKPDGSKVHCDLQLSPRLEQVIGNTSVLHIPNYNKDSGLTDYVPEVTKLLKEKVEQVANHYKLKNEYISFLLSICGYSIIEYDNILFSKATLLCEVNNFHVLVSVHIGNRFPQEKPKIVLRSVYYLQYEKPYLQNLDNYPYSPRWKADEMVRRLLTNLQEEIPKFQAACQSFMQP